MGLKWEIDSICLFDLHSKNKNSNLSNFGEAVLLKFDKLYSLENSIRSVYYNAYPMTMYFKIQYLKFIALSMPGVPLSVH